MAELLRNAWMGWFRVTGGAKIMGLFLIALLFLWIGYRQEKQRQLLRYGTAAALCCIVPVTAVALMLYQTRFYDYEWIWSIVPVTILTAYAGTKALAEHWQGFRREAWRKGLPVTVGLLAAALLCNVSDDAGIDRKAARAERAEAESILETVREEAGSFPSASKTDEKGVPEIAAAEGGSVCMWAPRKVLEHIRRLDSSILLPYGRNMWEEALGAYSYDIYSEEVEKMYQWMCIAEETCTENDFDMTDIMIGKLEEQELSTRECMESAKRAGVNLLILPENINRLLLDEVMKATGVRPEQVSGYYFFELQYIEK